MKESSNSAAVGYSLPTVVFIVFLVLKLTGQIGWSWWWVTSPLWISYGLLVAVMLIGITARCFMYWRMSRK